MSDQYYEPPAVGPTGNRGEPNSIRLAEISTVNADGSVDLKPLRGRGGKAQVPVPSWYVPTIGDRVFLAELDGNPLEPLVLGPCSPRDGSLAAPGHRFGTLIETSGTYTPAWTSTGTAPVIGNGTLAGRYVRHGKLVHVSINLTVGTTTTVGTGFYFLSLPVAPQASLRQIVTVDLFDAATQHYTGMFVLAGGLLTPEEIVVGSSAVGPTNWSATSPFAFGVGDRIVITGTYETA